MAEGLINRVAEQTKNPVINPDEVFLASGSVYPGLAEDIAQEMGLNLSPVTRKEFPNGEYYIKYDSSLRGRHVVAIQTQTSMNPNGVSVNDAIFEHLIMSEAAFKASAREVTLVAPHMAYLRQDRKVTARESLAARAMISMLTGPTSDRLVAVDMHSSQMQSVTHKPFDHLTAFNVLADSVRDYLTSIGAPHEDWFVVAPDDGATKASNRYRRYLGIDSPAGYMPKEREESDSSILAARKHLEAVKGRVVIIFDDMVDTSGTLVSSARALVESGATHIVAAATHGILSKDALKRIKDSPIEQLIVTDTIQQDQRKEVLGDQIRVERIAPVIARGLEQILTNGSVSELFNDRNHL